MSEDARGIVGDRRRNPFPSLNDTEYELFLLTVEKCVTAGVSKAMAKYQKDNCEDHQEQTERLATAVFGRREIGVVGMDEVVDGHSKVLTAMADDVKWFKRLLYSSLVIASLGLVFGLVQFAIVGK